jgi:acyl carrier protein
MDPNEKIIREKIRSFIQKKINHPVADHDDFITKGFVNSLFALELVVFVEKTFSIKVGDADLDLKNFNSVSAMAALVMKKQRS